MLVRELKRIAKEREAYVIFVNFESTRRSGSTIRFAEGNRVSFRY
jgi:hypothetical protein